MSKDQRRKEKILAEIEKRDKAVEEYRLALVELRETAKESWDKWISPQLDQKITEPSKKWGEGSVGDTFDSSEEIFNHSKQIWDLVKDLKKKVERGEPVRISSHLIEQTTKGTRFQLGLFDTTEPASKKIETSAELDGIDLTASEHKLVWAICSLLQSKSQTVDRDREDYYTGNTGAFLVPSKSKEAPKEKTPAPQIVCTLYEIAREYNGGENPSGQHIENVESILEELKEKRFTFTYRQGFKSKRGEPVVRTISGERPLLHVDRAKETVGGKETVNEKIITLEPIFRSQIADKFLLYPPDHIKRIEEAWGGKKVPSRVFNLANYLNQIRSGKQPKGRKPGEAKHTIYASNLFQKIDPRTVAQNRKSRLVRDTERALETCRKIGLLEDWELGAGKTGEKMYTLFINTEWD